MELLGVVSQGCHYSLSSCYCRREEPGIKTINYIPPTSPFSPFVSRISMTLNKTCQRNLHLVSRPRPDNQTFVNISSLLIKACVSSKQINVTAGRLRESSKTSGDLETTEKLKRPH
ncbi:hypothetical protein J6590_058932 [Homalodisca vitripennis]|nr:hypothetical protein J6590_058932 [Homalodisca vitripennis]